MFGYKSASLIQADLVIGKIFIEIIDGDLLIMILWCLIGVGDIFPYGHMGFLLLDGQWETENVGTS